MRENQPGSGGRSGEDISYSMVFLVALLLVILIPTLLLKVPTFTIDLDYKTIFGLKATPTSRPTITPTSLPMAFLPTATPTASPTPTIKLYKVGNTSGEGVYLRRTPNPQDRLVAWADNTLMEAAGEDVQVGEVLWRKVKDPRGNIGYIPARYLIPVTP
ncbi:MAG: SH3 domain-containing protein [Chloroflexi bacterium]|nr:SH3 domain-containing protein [Chloroflexota bacterium]MCL5075430.1 SH3 domain-containing protein [Chloroflexota bacterium]